MSSKSDVFLEEARLGPRSSILIECEEMPNLPRLIRRFKVRAYRYRPCSHVDRDWNNLSPTRCNIAFG